MEVLHHYLKGLGVWTELIWFVSFQLKYRRVAMHHIMAHGLSQDILRGTQGG